jgi:hypothetical protein
MHCKECQPANILLELFALLSATGTIMIIRKGKSRNIKPISRVPTIYLLPFTKDGVLDIAEVSRKQLLKLAS